MIPAGAAQQRPALSAPQSAAAIPRLPEDADPWRGNPILAAAGAEAAADLARLAQRRASRPGCIIAGAGEPAREIHILLEGRVEMLHRGTDDRQALSRILCPPNMFGDIEALNGVSWLTTVVALDACVTTEVVAAEYLGWLERNPAALMEHLRQLGAAYCLALCNERQVLHRLEQRAANLLLTYAEMYGRRVGETLVIERELSQRELARRLGVTRRAVGLVQEQWARQGLIERRGPFLALPRPELVERLAAPLRQTMQHRMGVWSAWPPEEIEEAAELWVVGGGETSSERRHIDDELTIGRRPTADLVLCDEAVSGLHCRIYRGASGGRFWVEDLDSLNGTRLNGEKVRRGVLRHGDRIAVGRTELEVTLRPRAPRSAW